MSVRLSYVQELLARRVLSPERAADARAAAADVGVDLDAWLRTAGCDDSELVLAACEVFSLTPASTSWLEAPLATDQAGAPWDAALFRALGAIPVHAGPPLRIAFASPFGATSERARALPTHRAYLATRDAIAAAQARVFPPAAPPEGGADAAISTSAPTRDDWAEAVEAGPVPPSSSAAATTKVPRVLAQNMAVVFDAIGNAAEKVASASAASPTANPVAATVPDEGDTQRTGRYMMEMPPPSPSPTSAAAAASSSGAPRPEATIVRMMKPLEEEDPIRPRMQGSPVALTPEIEAQLAEAAGLGGMTFGVRAIVKRATTAEEIADKAALQAKGTTALDLLRAVGALPAALAAKLMGDIARALEELHAQGLVHRELKPSHVLLSTSGQVTLADAGRAQASGVEEHVTDMFSLGRLFHHLLSGRDPFADGDAPPPDLMEIAPTLPELLPLVVDKLMKRERKERVQSARDAVELLAPLVQIIEARHPRLLADAVKDPAGVVKKLRVEQAFAEYLRASACMKQRPARKREAAYALRRSIELDSMELRGQKLLRKLCATEKYTFVVPDDPALVDAKNSDDVEKLRAAGEKCLASGAIEQAALCFRRAHDARLADIVGDDARQPFPFLPEVPASSATAVEAGESVDPNATSPSPMKLRVAVVDESKAGGPAPRGSRRGPRLLVASAVALAVLAVLALIVGRYLGA